MPRRRDEKSAAPSPSPRISRRRLEAEAAAAAAAAAPSVERVEESAEEHEETGEETPAEETAEETAEENGDDAEEAEEGEKKKPTLEERQAKLRELRMRMVSDFGESGGMHMQRELDSSCKGSNMQLCRSLSC